MWVSSYAFFFFFAVAKGVAPTASADYKPVVMSSVTYIAAGALVNENGEILMIQEAKSSCAGKWYLPAGRIEPGENIVVSENTRQNMKNVATISLFRLPHIVREIKSIELRWAEHVASMIEGRSIFKLVTGEPTSKSLQE